MVKQWQFKRVIWIGCFFICLILISQFVVVRWNLSSSLPGYIFIGTSWTFTPQRGDIISFDHPRFPAPIAKIVVGTAGDTINIINEQIIVNHVERGRILDKSPTSGKPLIPIQPCTIPKGYVYVWASHPESYDSRYAEIGLIHISRIKERLWRLF